MSKPEKFVFDECLDSPTETTAIEVDSMVNQTYIDNLPIMRKRIEEENQKNHKAYMKIENLIIR